MNGTTHITNHGPAADTSAIRDPRSAIVPGPSALRAAGMTLLDLTVSLGVIAAMLTALVGVSDGLVNDSADQQTSTALRTLQQGLVRYHMRHGVWPSSTEPRHIDTPIARCLAALKSSPETERLVADLPGLSLTALGFHTVHDGFGRAMLYIDPNDTTPVTADLMKRFPRSPQGRPFIVSAGLDGEFGDWSSDAPVQRAAAMDNHYSYDLETRK
jgi:type II secretory pathway pseudopilin PulG